MSDELFQLLREDMKAGFQRVCDRLDDMNGRVREAEQDIAVLKDRGGNRKSVLWGSGSGAAMVGVVEAVKAYFKP